MTRSRTVHGVLMLIAWPLLIAPGMFVARYVKPHSAAWFPTHIALQVTGLVAYISAFGLVAWEVGFSQAEHFKGWHGKIGLGVVILAVLQTILGMISHFIFKPERISVRLDLHFSRLDLY